MTINIPTFVKQRFTDTLGHLTPQMHLFFDQFTNTMIDNFSQDGLVVPSRTTDEINNIASSTNDNAKPDGTMWYDTEAKVLKVKINGAVKTVTTA